MFVAQQFTFSLCGLCGQESVDSFVLDAYTSLDGLQQGKKKSACLRYTSSDETLNNPIMSKWFDLHSSRDAHSTWFLFVHQIGAADPQYPRGGLQESSLIPSVKASSLIRLIIFAGSGLCDLCFLFNSDLVLPIMGKSNHTSVNHIRYEIKYHFIRFTCSVAL